MDKQHESSEDTSGLPEGGGFDRQGSALAPLLWLLIPLFGCVVYGLLSSAG